MMEMLKMIIEYRLCCSNAEVESVIILAGETSLQHYLNAGDMEDGSVDPSAGDVEDGSVDSTVDMWK